MESTKADKGRFLATLEEFAREGSKGFTLQRQGEQREAFLVQQSGQVFAYLNSCPHTGAPLDWMPDRFLVPEGNFIQCAMHGAIFEIDSGLCLYGPCSGKRLTRVKVLLEGGRVYLEG